MKQPKILLVGVGKFGKNHLRVLKDLENVGLCELRGVADLNSNNLSVATKKYGVGTSTNFHDFLGDGVDAVDVVTSSSTHYGIAKECLTVGKHVFVEKPLTTCYREAKELVELAEKQDKTLMVGHIFRYNFAVRQIKQLIEKGKLGKIYYLFGHFMGLKTPKPDVGALINYTVHHIDIYNYLLQQTPKEVTCNLSYPLGRKYEDVAWVALKYPGGVTAFIEGGWLPPGKHRDLTVVGSHKSVFSDLLEQTVEIHHSYIDCDGGKFQAVDRGFEKGTLPFDQKFKEPLKLELQDFISAIKTGQQPISNGNTALSVIKTIEKAYESALQHRTIYW